MLRLESVTLSYGTRPVLADLSLEVHPGEILGLIGPNGAGKSTLIRAASGVLAAGSGNVSIDGTPLSRWPPRERAKRIAVVPQAATAPPAITVHQTVMLGRAAHAGWRGRESQTDRDAVDEALRRTGTEPFSHRFLAELSGGERQLVFLARALAQKPRYLLLDEPTTHLDLRHEIAILALLEDLARTDQLGILTALHDLNIAARHCHRIALVAGGSLRALGTPGEVLTAPLLSSAYGVPVSIFRDPASGMPVIFASCK